MTNKYDGYIYDSCSWGVTVAWTDDERYGIHEEFIYNDFCDNEDFEDFMYFSNIAINYEEYKKGEVEET